ncbi:BRO-N domain-containing protein [Nostoc sp. UIC 10890]
MRFVALRRLDKDEKGTCTIPTLGGNQSMMSINESGLYSLVLTSRKPQAKRFKK